MKPLQISPETAQMLAKKLNVPLEHLMHMPKHILMQKMMEAAKAEQQAEASSTAGAASDEATGGQTAGGTSSDRDTQSPAGGTAEPRTERQP
ncbi:YycC family protein [Paenibacillus sp. y28]|uniref:YycC family protein n=1 Tax=Paenibacillus sp. y28 TaxID=3129110 RepID=UPI003FA68463